MDIPATKILLIEDDEEDFILLKKHLSRIAGAKYEIQWETSYEQGLARMLEGQHDVCFIDFLLGASNGIKLIAEARKRGYHHPIILLTGATNSELDIQALQAGADDYISKSQLQGELLYRIIRYTIERKKAEYERERLIREHIANRELEQKRNEFIGMVVHELKTPLTSLKGFAHLLRRKSEKTGDERTLQMLARMDSQIVKLTGLIDDFLDVTRITSGKLQFREDFFDFDRLVEETVEELKPTTDHHTIRLEGKTGKIIWGDQMRIGQVIINFISNAIKYAPDTNLIIVSISSDDQHVTLQVKDFGPGIPIEYQDKIFDPFYRIERQDQRTPAGLGLGLHISAEMIQRQGGKIWLESEPGKGSTFCFSLPIARHGSAITIESAELKEQER